ncbi:C39 family peptidase [Flexivirga sp. B27]
MHGESVARRDLFKGAAAGAGLVALGAAVAPEAQAANWKVLPFTYQAQVNGYWCGPTATAIALSCRGISVSQQQMANELGTTTNGTDWIGQVTRVLNNYVGWYETKEIPNDPPTQAQKDLLWHDITYNVDHGYALVANIWAPANNHLPGYPNYLIMHYFTVVGYNPDTMQAYIADPANFGGNSQYWLTFDQLASLIPPKGYSA